MIEYYSESGLFNNLISLSTSMYPNFHVNSLVESEGSMSHVRDELMANQTLHKLQRDV